MNWRRCALNSTSYSLWLINSFLALTCVLLLLLLPLETECWSRSATDSQPVWTPYNLTLKSTAVPAPAAPRQLNEVSPFIDLVVCSLRAKPWHCARQQSARILNIWDDELYAQWQKLKVEADRQLNSTLERRGYSASESPIKEKPSSLLKKIEIGTNFMRKYLAEAMEGFLEHEYEYLQSEAKESPLDSVDENRKANVYEEETAGADNGNTDEEESDSDEGDTDADADAIDDDNNNDLEEDDETVENNVPIITTVTPAAQATKNSALKDTNLAPNANDENLSSGLEFIEIQDAHEANAAAAESVTGQLKKPGKVGKRKKHKKKGSAVEPATLVVVQAAPTHDVHDVSSEVEHGHGHAKPAKQKIKRRRHKKKRKGHGGEEAVDIENAPVNHLGLGLLEELVDANVNSDAGGKRKHKKPSKYGRSNGVTRGKKKKKKEALAKLMLLGSFVKAKIELLLRIFGTHLQVKFFTIALIGLLINIARFWMDVKRGGVPQKVVYVEHAHHQHHYEDHGDEWSSEPGSYWKRSLQRASPLDNIDASTSSYQVRPPLSPYSQQPPRDAHYMAYRNPWQ